MDADYLGHIQKAIEEIREITKGMDRAAYGADIKAQRAVERDIQIIGDAVHKLSAELTTSNPDVEWAKIYAARNVVVHFYWGVDQNILWDVVQTKLDPLHAKVVQLLGPEPAPQAPPAAAPPPALEPPKDSETS